MKRYLWKITTGLLAIALGVQGYVVYELNERVAELTAARATPPPLASVWDDPAWNDPFASMRTMHKRMDRLFGADPFGGAFTRDPWRIGARTMEFVLREEDERYVIEAEIPGAEKASVKVSVEEDRLHVVVESERREADGDPRSDDYTAQRQFVGKVERTLALPGPVDSAGMQTQFEDGTLRITIPKAEMG